MEKQENDPLIGVSMKLSKTPIPTVTMQDVLNTMRKLDEDALKAIQKVVDFQPERGDYLILPRGFEMFKYLKNVMIMDVDTAYHVNGEEMRKQFPSIHSPWPGF